MPRRTATLEDVARAAGVSQQTRLPGAGTVLRWCQPAPASR